jgi:23S rRNA (adenine2503-C2)-methyltransferase
MFHFQKSKNLGVLIPEGTRNTLCVSSQCGCSLNCSFCKTGTQKFERNLTTNEILCQVLISSNVLGSNPTNIVFMGQGEPLFNLRNVIEAVNIITDKDGIAIPKRKITVSTSGVVTGMKRLAMDTGVEIAISLHATNDKLRDVLVPLNKTFPLDVLLNECKLITPYTPSKR